ncbi:DUF4145 domain-containing protein [Anthocerotibacter panamensis]|uniref:DUF4145 domain-containing protein n=1 Tax=Anthocerotibacter panamensis TaxID=2857077 RepID=UPI001C408775|nr:DUF4145 domain-containing protein [Anthocerotibacter panamensis]
MSNFNIAALHLAKSIKADVDSSLLPPSEGQPSSSERVIYLSLVKGTRHYIEQIAHQINGCYENGWYDACAVMIRRLIETLIIESFEAHSIASKIKSSSGDFLSLKDLINSTVNETTWAIGRNACRALPRLKDIGNKSAHSRRYVAHRQDIDKVIDDLRIVIQELLFLSRLKE